MPSSICLTGRDILDECNPLSHDLHLMGNPQAPRDNPRGRKLFVRLRLDDYVRLASVANELDTPMAVLVRRTVLRNLPLWEEEAKENQA